MGYHAEIVRGYGYRIDTCDLEYSGDPQGILTPWNDLLEKGYDHVRSYTNYPDLVILMTGDSRAPMPNQGLILALVNSMRAGNDYAPHSNEMAQLNACIKEHGLTYDEGPAFFEDTFVI